MTLLIQGAQEAVLRGRYPKYSCPLFLTPYWLEAMFPVFPCTLLAPPFPVLGLDSRGVGNLMNSFPPPQGHAQNPLQVGAELQSRFFASQGCNQSPFQTCEAAFATKDRLRAHTVRHEEKVPCHVCGKMLSAAYISDHMKVHSQGPHHVCELCNKGTGEVCPMAAAASAAAAAAAAAAVAAATPTAVGSLSGAEGVPVSSQPLPSQPW
ncbi:myc-associated zinc finger protein isoform X4 [Dromiciops gliroides]|uniref:myc-associated zinc finger protein isoform X4 n=1 Tax=Dromiciops gliroides TaxID=33562 RepID=UPI001CC5A11F|nr:myc-associated zinc finger protein isoform X4 [Dromiciops gliroides]